MPSTRPILVVGAGFAGATYARELANAGYGVEVIDTRPHIAGNAFDHVCETGQRLHKYGPHLFHTSNEAVVNWITRFAEFVPYEHKVEAVLETGELVPLPINRQTINTVFGTSLETPDSVVTFLKQRAEIIDPVISAADHLNSHIGSRLTDLFFRPYNRKMWQMELEQLDAAVVKRIPLRHDDEDRYFPSDRFQALPVGGYTALVASILDHPSIAVSTGTSFHRSMMNGTAHCFNSMPIDEYYDACYGPLPYRSIRFHHRTEPDGYRLGHAATINFTDDSRFTRQTDWSLLAGHDVRSTGRKTLTTEEPCDYLDNGMERYYPVKTSDGRHDLTYRRYQERASSETGLSFIGRCGTYQYLDMHQVINQSLIGAAGWLSRQPH